MSLYLGENLISGVATPIEPTRNVGQIITSTIPLTDAGLHLLDGSLIQGDGIYNDFVQYIANLVNIYPQCFTDETTWQNAVNDKGVCGKFVYDSTNNTVRLPKITGFIEGTIDSNALGELVEAGLPNITGNFNFADNIVKNDQSAQYMTAIDGCFYSSSVTANTCAVNNVSVASVESNNRKLTIDASRSNSIYSNSNTVQPQAIKVFYYIVIATTTKTDIEVDIDEIATDLNSKANDTDVVHKIGNEIISGTKTFNNAINLANYTWNAVGDDAYIGDFNVGGAVCIKGNNSSTRLMLINRDETVNLGFYIDENDGNALKLTSPAYSATSWGSVTAMMAQSLGGNGYIKFNHGLVIQWGNASGGGTITFPTPFSSDNFSVTATIKAANGTNDNDAITAKRTTSFDFHNYSGGGCLWIAIGF